MLILLQLLITSLMTGVIWAVQVAIYPMFLWVSPTESKAYFKNYQQKISFLVVPLMLLEFAFACALFFIEGTGSLFSSLNLISILFIWAITCFESVKRHKELLQNYQKSTVKRLVLGNWFRTALWSIRTMALCLYVLN